MGATVQRKCPCSIQVASAAVARVLSGTQLLHSCVLSPGARQKQWQVLFAGLDVKRSLLSILQSKHHSSNGRLLPAGSAGRALQWASSPFMRSTFPRQPGMSEGQVQPQLRQVPWQYYVTDIVVGTHSTVFRKALSHHCGECGGSGCWFS